MTKVISFRYSIYGALLFLTYCLNGTFSNNSCLWNVFSCFSGLVSIGSTSEDIQTIYNFCYNNSTSNESRINSSSCEYCSDNTCNATDDYNATKRPSNLIIAYSNNDNDDINDVVISWDNVSSHDDFYLVYEMVENKENVFKVVNSTSHKVRLSNLCTLCNISVAASYNGSLTPFSDMIYCPANYKTDIAIEPNITISPIVYQLHGHEHWNEMKVVYNFSTLWQERLQSARLKLNYFLHVKGDFYVCFISVSTMDVAWMTKVENVLLSGKCPMLAHIKKYEYGESSCRINFTINKLINLTFSSKRTENISCIDLLKQDFHVFHVGQLSYLNRTSRKITIYSIIDEEMVNNITEQNDLTQLLNQTVIDELKIDHYEDVALVDINSNIQITSFDRESKLKPLIYILPAVAVLLIAMILMYFLMLKKRRSKFGNDGSNLRAIRNTYGEIFVMNDQWEIPRDNLHMNENLKLGSGEFGTVYKGQLVNPENLPYFRKLSNTIDTLDYLTVAVKTLSDSVSILAKERFIEEIDMMKKIGYHNQLINLVGCITVSEPFCLIIEYCSNGDLHHYLREKRHYMVEKQLADCHVDENFVTLEILLQFAWQISSGMEYLAEHNFVHRDLACRNILLDEHMNTKIGDFGLCRYVPSHLDLYYRSNGGRLPIKWMALESILEYKFTSSSDVWSFGIVLFELFTFASSPYPDVEAHSIGNYLKSGQRMEKPEGCPFEIYNLMQMMWHEDPSQRPTFTDLKIQIQQLIEELKGSDYNYVTLLSQNTSYYNVVKDEI